jgi:hypothetical protein
MKGGASNLLGAHIGVGDLEGHAYGERKVGKIAVLRIAILIEIDSTPRFGII